MELLLFLLVLITALILTTVLLGELFVTVIKL
jgi:hypothetical protein